MLLLTVAALSHKVSFGVCVCVIWLVVVRATIAHIKVALTLAVLA